jgi:DNA-binding NarL/FixJ family response regulator
MMIKVLLVDDQASVRIGLRMRLALEPDLEVVGEAEDGEQALVQAAKLCPNVVVMDVAMPNMDGIAATDCLHKSQTAVAVVMLSIHDNAQVRAQARAAGAADFVVKGATEPLIIAIRRAARI